MRFAATVACASRGSRRRAGVGAVRGDWLTRGGGRTQSYSMLDDTPRVMRWRPARAQRSVDRGTRRLGALLQHVDIDRLRAAHGALNPKATAAVDEVTWYDYGQDLEANLRDPHARVHRGAYRAGPSRRVYIPKADGRQRPLGVAGLEDKFSAKQKVELVLGRFVGPVDRGDLSRARHLRDAAAASA
jgi:hypothetical protein